MTTNYSVKLKDTDDSTYGYPKRYVEFKTRSGSFETPTRAVTNHEYAQKVASRTDITYDPDVSIFVERCDFPSGINGKNSLGNLRFNKRHHDFRHTTQPSDYKNKIKMDTN